MPRQAKGSRRNPRAERPAFITSYARTEMQQIESVLVAERAPYFPLIYYPRTSRPKLSVNQFFYSTAEPEALFGQSTPQLNAECSFQNYINCCMYYRRKQILSELEWKKRVFGSFASQAVPIAQQFGFLALYKTAKRNPLYPVCCQIKYIRDVLFTQGQQLKSLYNDETKALHNQKIRKAKINYILTKTAKMCNQITEEMKGLENDPVPYFIDTTENQLRPYYVHGFKFLLACSQLNYNAILADDLGLGKSLYTICLLAALAERGIYGPHLIIVPSTLIYNWQNEFYKWFPAANVMVYFGNKQEREKQRTGWSFDKKFSVLLTSYNTAVMDAYMLKRRHFYYLIMDEAHLIRNSSSRAWNVLLSFSCYNKLLISGTPISNSASDIWSLLHFVLPGFFASKSEFLELFARDVERMADGELGVNYKLVKSIHQLLRPFMLRRLKSEVESYLPKKQEFIVPCPLTRKQLYLYNEFMYADSGKNTKSYLHIVSILTQLRKICNHPRLLEDGDVENGFCMGEGVFYLGNFGYNESMKNYRKTDLEVIYKKNPGWWNNYGDFLPADIRRSRTSVCDCCGKKIVTLMNTGTAKSMKFQDGKSVDLEKMYKMFENDPKMARYCLTSTIDFECTIEPRYCMNLLFTVEYFQRYESAEICRECQTRSDGELAECTLLQPGKDDVRYEYTLLNRFSIVRNVHCFRDYRLDCFTDKAPAFMAISSFKDSYIYQYDTIDAFTFDRFCYEIERDRFYTWDEHCMRHETQYVAYYLRRIYFKKSLLCMLQKPFFDARLVKLLFDPLISYGCGIFSHAVMLEFCDTEAMQNVCMAMLQLISLQTSGDFAYYTTNLYFCTENAFLSPALIRPYEKSLVGGICMSNYFLNYFYQQSYEFYNFLEEELMIPYPNRYFYQNNNIEYYQMKSNLKLMRANQQNHSAFYVPTRNIGLTRFLYSMQPTFGVFYQAKPIANVKALCRSQEARLCEQICMPHETEILNIEGIGGEARICYNEYKLEISMKEIPAVTKKWQFIKNYKMPENAYFPGMILLHLCVPNIGYWSMVNAFIPPQTLFKYPFCVLPISAGAYCCCNPESYPSQFNSYSFNQHTFTFKKLTPTELFTKYQMYSIAETYHPADLDEASANIIVRPGTVSYLSRFELANSAIFASYLAKYIQAPNHSDLIQESGKLIVLRYLLKHLSDRGCKCLIFTQQTKMLDILETFLTSLHYYYYRMDGMTYPKMRQQLVDRFNAFYHIFCFIMTTRTGGIGLNLTGANTVIFVDCDWNPYIHYQATDRVHRINQTREVEVYTLVSEYTVEENIVRRATQKKHLDKLIMRDGGFVPEFFEQSDRFANRIEHRFSQREREIYMVYVSLIDEKQAGQRLSDVLDAFYDEDDYQARMQLLQEYRGDIEDNQQEDEIQIVETGQQLMRQVEIYTALQNSPPVFLRFFEEGYQSVPNVVLEETSQVAIFGFDENVKYASLSEKKRYMYQTYYIDRELFERTVKDLEHYTATQMHDDVAKMEVSRTKARVKKIEVYIKARSVQVGGSD